MSAYAISQGPVAVIDIGSNSVRLVAYDRLGRAPVPMFNEKTSLCGLGREVAVTGLLPADGLVQARDALKRFRVLCKLMKIERLFILATAAARRASNGPAFIAEVEDILGEPVSQSSVCCYSDRRQPRHANPRKMSDAQSICDVIPTQSNPCGRCPETAGARSGRLESV